MQPLRQQHGGQSDEELDSLGNLRGTASGWGAPNCRSPGGGRDRHNPFRHRTLAGPGHAFRGIGHFGKPEPRRRDDPTATKWRRQFQARGGQGCGARCTGALCRSGKCRSLGGHPGTCLPVEQRLIHQSERQTGSGPQHHLHAKLRGKTRSLIIAGMEKAVAPIGATAPRVLDSSRLRGWRAGRHCRLPTAARRASSRRRRARSLWKQPDRLPDRDRQSASSGRPLRRGPRASMPGPGTARQRAFVVWAPLKLNLPA